MLNIYIYMYEDMNPNIAGALYLYIYICMKI